jgi:hypothetical protein
MGNLEIGHGYCRLIGIDELDKRVTEADDKGG